MPAKSSPRRALASRWWRSGAIRKTAAVCVSAPQSVRLPPRRRQPVSSMLTAAAERICSESRAWGSRSAAPACCTIESIEPVESSTPNSSPISSTVSRRETRLRTASAATAACRRGPKAPRGTSAGSSARVSAAQAGQAVLADPDRDRRELVDLVALRRGCVGPLVLAKAARAGLAALGPVLDHLVHALERKQRAAPALMSSLTTRPASRDRLPRSRRRRGRILRGRQRGVTRAAVQALLELGNAGLEPPVRLDELAHPRS